jgi:hypothetical protein
MSGKNLKPNSMQQLSVNDITAVGGGIEAGTAAILVGAVVFSPVLGGVGAALAGALLMGYYSKSPCAN